jgi:hypothetical protein
MENINNLSQLWTMKPDKVHLGAYTIHHIETHLYLKIKGERVVLARK